MQNKQKRNLFFLSFFLLFGFSLAVRTELKAVAADEQAGVIFQKPSEIWLQQVFFFDGLLQPCIKVAESNNTALRGCKNGNKYPALFLYGNLTVAFTSFHRSYSRLRSERGSASPFYIAYHRLII